MRPVSLTNLDKKKNLQLLKHVHDNTNCQEVKKEPDTRMLFKKEE